MENETQNFKKTINKPVSILMPVCNEEDVIEDVVREWIQDVFLFLPNGSEMIFDDCSTDKTTEILMRFREKYNFINIIRSPKDGFFNAAMRLYNAAKCPYIFFTDSDGQYVAADFWRVQEYIDTYDMIHGMKVKRKDPVFRLIASKAFNFITRVLFPMPKSSRDINAAFRLIKREVLDAVLPETRNLPTLINSEIYVRALYKGFRIKNIPISHKKRKSGVSRGLPPKKFIYECIRSFLGLLKIRRIIWEKI